MIGFLGSLEKKVDVLEFVKDFGSGAPLPSDEVVAGFKALIGENLLGLLAPEFIAAANKLVEVGLLPVPISMGSLIGAKVGA